MVSWEIFATLREESVCERKFYGFAQIRKSSSLKVDAFLKSENEVRCVSYSNWSFVEKEYCPNFFPFL